MGLFPEIGRAWLTIDNRLFLWNYEDGYPRSGQGRSHHESGLPTDHTVCAVHARTGPTFKRLTSWTSSS